MATKKKQVASGHQGEKLRSKRSERKESERAELSGSESKRGTPSALARLTRLEEVTVAQVNHPATPFARVIAVSNPGFFSEFATPSNEWWFEHYRTIRQTAVAEVLRLTQEVIVGCTITSSKSEENAARQECYGLLEEVEDRIAGFMPYLADDIEIIFPMHDIDAQFSQMEQEGVFQLTVMWSLTWQISKGAKTNA